MKKWIVLGLSVTLLAACSAEKSNDKSEVKSDKTEQVDKSSRDYKHGLSYGKYAAKFDKENFGSYKAKRHDGTAWTKDYSDGYYDGYASVEK